MDFNLTELDGGVDSLIDSSPQAGFPEEQQDDFHGFDFLVLKIASRCNLNCSYCYMYNLGDKTYLQQPKVMREDIVDALLKKAYAHVLKYKLTAFAFGFHGGEPILAGKKFFVDFIRKANETFSHVNIVPSYYMQTNGVLITKSMGRLFRDLNIQIGVSLDGTEETHDRYRVDHKGRGSYHRVIAGINNLTKNSYNGRIEAGVLNVINLESDPVSLYYHYVETLNVFSFDMLLPLANYETLPPLVRKGEFMNSETPYADWLLIMFNLWYHDNSEKRPYIRLFNTIVKQVLGAQAALDTLGSNNNNLLVIETDGGIEPTDVLKMCGHGFTKQNLNVLDNQLEDAYAKPLISNYVQNEKHLCEQCKTCPIVEMCGGGHLPHRYSSLNGFDNPTVYCKDLIKLISEIQSIVVGSLPAEVLELCKVQPLDYRAITKQLYN